MGQGARWPECAQRMDGPEQGPVIGCLCSNCTVTACALHQQLLSRRSSTSCSCNFAPSNLVLFTREAFEERLLHAARQYARYAAMKI